jgi:hypothetical protein
MDTGRGGVEKEEKWEKEDWGMENGKFGDGVHSLYESFVVVTVSSPLVMLLWFMNFRR